MMSCGTAGSLVQEVLGEAEQDLWHPGKLQPWTYRSTLSVSQCCIVLSQAEAPYHLTARCTALSSPPCPCNLALSQSAASCLSCWALALLAELA